MIYFLNIKYIMSAHKKKAPKKYKQGKKYCLVRRKVSVKAHTRKLKKKGAASAAGKGSRVYGTTSVNR